MRKLFSSFFLIVGLAACGGGSTAPNDTPTPTPAPTPVPTATPNAFAQACGTPLPNLQDLYGFAVKVQLEPTLNKKVLNASPIVKNAAYCASVGQPGELCRTRFEDQAQRVPCDHYMSGMSDEGRPGPTWYQNVNGVRLRCGGLSKPGDAPNCTLKEENQYLLDVRAPGHYIACAGVGSNLSCGECVLAPNSFDRLHGNPAGLCGLTFTVN
jgi:hypothetical protein